jgi:putative restriction endonuclease
LATSDAYAAPRPQTRTFGKWHSEGFKIDVDLEILKPPIDTEIFRRDFINLYNDRCDPRLFDVNGKPSQQYMISLPEGAGAAILEATGDAAILVQDKISSVTQPKKKATATQRDAIVKARVGQGRFRDDVLKMWTNQCPVTKVDMPEILVASHIVSWQLSTDEEKVDAFNGFPLSPAVDKLFDKGYISFSDSGGLLLHNCIRRGLLIRLGIDPDAMISGLSERHRAYLKRHRQTHGFSG